ncbi:MULTISPECIES: hypothetical protein [Mycobacterium]|uniref:Uncharacterized protein n=1 Tax=Mycobacterium kiyosense TaxID=2871094 RepID=A0AA37PS31_9MYCO|nr:MULTISPECIES: hypothetical protein [Mycobacterium]BDB42474.1 hypothetical protein IWGMT90018_29200 [Mycobacterium kiyosense]BDE14263.1 hypothetical protein MKCMC460_31230 [Mycobacterium sp. 20KCMC460]GLB81521.1 hypothetical protein SRL2020028_07770 [Mycobacterium kiyosense]GLB90118.1 hypothetical protein SRL2020130_29350 [Mycobacterium kiyosense]GLB93714.1 hypothetical protein SRL2020226_04900 [Mycobacterium kiyosense]
MSVGRATLGGRPLLVAMVAGASYGSWAAVVNHGAGLAAALRAAATQMSMSVVASFALQLLLTRLFFWARTPGRGFWLSSMGTSTLAAAVLTAGHAVNGTPHLAATLAPSLVIGTTFCFGYARALLARERATSGN